MTDNSNDIKGGKVVLYKNKVEVNLKDNTVWLTQRRIAELFQKDVRTVNEPLVNIHKEKELQQKSTIRNFLIVQKEGKLMFQQLGSFAEFEERRGTIDKVSG